MTTETLEQNAEEQEKEVVALKLADKGFLMRGNRPVEVQHLQIVSTYGSLSSRRPVVKSGLEIKNTLTISGNRPIVASHLKISKEYVVMANRPVASNEIDDAASLMGYLD